MGFKSLQWLIFFHAIDSKKITKSHFLLLETYSYWAAVR